MLISFLLFIFIFFLGIIFYFSTFLSISFNGDFEFDLCLVLYICLLLLSSLFSELTEGEFFYFAFYSKILEEIKFLGCFSYY
jgi:hypothetical protein